VHSLFSKFEPFYAEVGDPPTLKHTLDRIDNERGYEPGNLRWATIQEQMRNRRNNVYLDIGGTVKLLVEWCEISGVNYSLAAGRIKNGWDAYSALTLPKIIQPPKIPPRRRGMRRLFTIDGSTQSFAQWCKHYGITQYRFKKHLMGGMTPLEALTTPKKPKHIPKIIENKHGYPGVTYKQNRGKYCAKIAINGKRIDLGYFNTAKEAGEAYQKAKQGI
jgi:hypothetical protein